MSFNDPNTVTPYGRPVSSSDAERIARAIEDGWIGRGFKLGIGFFLAGVVIWLIPLTLLVSCVGGLAAIGAAADQERSVEAARDAVEAIQKERAP